MFDELLFFNNQFTHQCNYIDKINKDESIPENRKIEIINSAYSQLEYFIKNINKLKTKK